MLISWRKLICIQPSWVESLSKLGETRQRSLFSICSKNTTAVNWKEQAPHLGKGFCLFFSSLLVIQLSVLQINCLISVPHSQDFWGCGKPGSCVPVILEESGIFCCWVCPLTAWKVVLANLRGRDAHLSVHLEGCLARKKVLARKSDEGGGKSENTFLSFMEIETWQLPGGANQCHGDVYILIVFHLSPEVQSASGAKHSKHSRLD